MGAPTCPLNPKACCRGAESGENRLIETFIVPGYTRTDEAFYYRTFLETSPTSYLGTFTLYRSARLPPSTVHAPRPVAPPLHKHLPAAATPRRSANNGPKEAQERRCTPLPVCRVGWICTRNWRAANRRRHIRRSPRRLDAGKCNACLFSFAGAIELVSGSEMGSSLREWFANIRSICFADVAS